jgi:hypothetical protein
MYLYTVISVFIKYSPDDDVDPSGSKNVAVQITKNNAVSMVFFFINQFEHHRPSMSGRTTACNQNNAGYF